MLYFSRGFLSNTCLEICKANNNGKYIYTHCCKSYSEKDQHTAVNCLSSGETGSYSKEHVKKNKQTKNNIKQNIMQLDFLKKG